ncbi:MAG: caspase family protein, partial [Rhodospirillales bacterium]|nr:caspase family protein [Rhodospirillales bacterium]
IGNSKYAKTPLKNAANDARAVSRSLRRLGFEVIERIDTGKKSMEDAILEFGEKLKAGGVGMFCSDPISDGQTQCLNSVARPEPALGVDSGGIDLNRTDHVANPANPLEISVTLEIKGAGLRW